MRRRTRPAPRRRDPPRRRVTVARASPGRLAGRTAHRRRRSRTRGETYAKPPTFLVRLSGDAGAADDRVIGVVLWRGEPSRQVTHPDRAPSSRDCPLVGIRTVIFCVQSYTTYVPSPVPR